MSVSENFDRKFNKCMRGYNPEEVDAAVDALLRYCDDLEDANKEFEIANNDLIDEKTALASLAENLKKENEELEKKAERYSSNLAKIEAVYNEYRTKFGEARNLVVNAKTSASEILSRAEKESGEMLKKAGEKCSALLSDAERKSKEALDESNAKRKAMLAELDKEILQKRKFIDNEIKQKEQLLSELDRTYSGFCDFLYAKLGEMLGTVSEMRDRKIEKSDRADFVSEHTSDSASYDTVFGHDDPKDVSTAAFPIEDIASEAEIPNITSDEEESDIENASDTSIQPVSADLSFSERTGGEKTEEKAAKSGSGLSETKPQSQFYIEKEPSEKDTRRDEMRGAKHTPAPAKVFMPKDSSENLSSSNDLLASLKQMMDSTMSDSSEEKIQSAHSSPDKNMAELKNVLEKINERVIAKKNTPNT